MCIAIWVPDETPGNGIANYLEIEHMSFAKLTNTLMYWCATILEWQLMNPQHSVSVSGTRVIEERFQN